MGDSAYKVVEMIGTSDKSWEEAARNAVETASQSLKHMRVAEIKELGHDRQRGRQSDGLPGEGQRVIQVRDALRRSTGGTVRRWFSNRRQSHPLRLK